MANATTTNAHQAHDVDTRMRLREERLQRRLNREARSSTVAPASDVVDEVAEEEKSTETIERLAQGKLLIKSGDLLQATDDIIVHQTNCVSSEAKGLARSLFHKFPHADTYKRRRRPSKAGSITVRGKRGGKQRLVVNLNAQYNPGKPSTEGKDSEDARKDYFWNCLEGLGDYIKHHKGTVTVGRPWRIGCGLAGGQWPQYYEMIEDWVRYARSASGEGVIVNMYRLAASMSESDRTNDESENLDSHLHDDPKAQPTATKNPDIVYKRTQRQNKTKDVKTNSVDANTRWKVWKDRVRRSQALTHVHGRPLQTSTKAEWRQRGHSAYTVVGPSTICDGRGLFALEKIKEKQRVARIP